jgi:hypothetical protein
VLCKQLGETQWTIRHGRIPTDDEDSLRHTLPTLHRLRGILRSEERAPE